jgi:RNA polymerase sigma-70 factor (ECF subfamily)
MHSYTTYADDELVRLLQEGDRRAFEALYDRYWQSLYDAAYKRLANREQSEDVLQDVFARLWVRRTQLAIQHIAAYLFSSVRYEVIHYLNRHRTAPHFYQPFEVVVMETHTADEQLMVKDLLELVYAYAETLPEKRKQVFLLHVKNKLSTKEIAEQLGINQKTVQNQLGTALKGLKDRLSPMIILLVTHRF